MKHQIGQLTLECVQGDIAAQDDCDAVVNAANSQLMSGGGVAGAIHRAAGPGLAQECVPLAPIGVGEAVITGGHNLPNQYVIHCLGPVYGEDQPEAALLASCYRDALRLAEEKGIKSIAFPAISTGVFGYPLEDAATIAFETILAAAADLNSVQRIRFVLYTEKNLKIHEQMLGRLIDAG